MIPPALRGLPSGIWLLSLAQGLGLTAAVISVNVAALAGADLCGSPSLATLPYGLQFAAVVIAAPLGSMLMGRVGRQPVFQVASFCGVAAGAIGAVAIARESFALLCLAHATLGVFLANVALFRFASLDLVAKGLRPAAMSLVLFGGVFASLLGPLLAREAPRLLDSGVYEAAYLAIGACGLAVGALVAFVRMPPVEARRAAGAEPAAPPPERLSAHGPYLLAVAAGAVGYGLMNMLMIAASLDMREQGMSFDHVSYAIQVHVFCMFFPSFFAGWAIGRMGIYRFLLLGAALQAAAGGAALASGAFLGYVASLVLLGLAWNALYVGGSHLVGQAVEGAGRFRAQGLNEFVVGVASTAGALFAGLLLAAVGWEALNVVGVVAAAMLAAAALLVGRAARRGAVSPA